MKILFLNPHIDAAHSIARALQTRGVALLQPADATEAWQMLQLHGTSVDLAILHREGSNGNGEPGVEFVARLKRDPAQADLPMVVTSEKWGDAESAEHQRGPNGANAYLTYPFTENQLVEIIEAVTGTSLGGASAAEVVESLPSANTGAFDPSLLMEAPSAPAAEPEPAIIPEAESASLMLEPAGSLSFEPQAAEIEAPSDLPSGSINLEISMNIPTATGAGSGKLDLDAPISDPEYLKSVEPLDDDEIADDMPYLFGDKGSAPPILPSGEILGAPIPAGLGPAAMVMGQPVGDAVVPGGAAHSPDLETLKKYLLLREQDVAALSSQLKSARERVSSVEDVLRVERGRGTELSHVVEEQKKRIEDFDREKGLALEALQGELAEAKFDLKAKTDKSRVLELQVREATEETEKLRERVRLDIRKIRVREKELENRLEIMKKDSEALIGARENKIIELKRKLDLLEFNMDLLQDQYSREKENAIRLRERLAKAAQVVRVAEGLLDQTGVKSSVSIVEAESGDGDTSGGERAAS